MAKTWSSTPGAERTERASCALCGAREAAPRFAATAPGGMPFAFVRCRRCGLVYQDPRPVPADLHRRYDAAYFAYELANEEAFFDLMRRGLRDIRFDRLAAVIPAPRTFLDVGCATGRLLQWLAADGWDARGVDVCRESAEYGRRERGVDIHAGTLEEARFADGRFAVVHCSHLIEHLDDPRAFLREVRRVLCDDGRAVITTPNVDGLQARLFASGWRSAIVDHLVLFGRATLRRMLGEEGFVVEREVTWGGLAAGTAPAWLKRPADRLAKRWGFGDVMLYLARKR
jgi:SAM-dependent methyltransferase